MMILKLYHVILAFVASPVLSQKQLFRQANTTAAEVLSEHSESQFANMNSAMFDWGEEQSSAAAFGWGGGWSGPGWGGPGWARPGWGGPSWGRPVWGGPSWHGPGFGGPWQGGGSGDNNERRHGAPSQPPSAPGGGNRPGYSGPGFGSGQPSDGRVPTQPEGSWHPGGASGSAPPSGNNPGRSPGTGGGGGIPNGYGGSLHGGYGRSGYRSGAVSWQPGQGQSNANTFASSMVDFSEAAWWGSGWGGPGLGRPGWGGPGWGRPVWGGPGWGRPGWGGPGYGGPWQGGAMAGGLPSQPPSTPGGWGQAGNQPGQHNAPTTPTVTSGAASGSIPTAPGNNPTKLPGTRPYTQGSGSSRQPNGGTAVGTPQGAWSQARGGAFQASSSSSGAAGASGPVAETMFSEIQAPETATSTSPTSVFFYP